MPPKNVTLPPASILPLNLCTVHRSSVNKVIANNGVSISSSDSGNVISLPDGMKIILGRSEITKIQGQNCSRQQIIIKAKCKEYANCSFETNQLGVTPSASDGVSMHTSTVQDPSVEIIVIKYPDGVELHPIPEDNLQRLATEQKPEDQVKPENIAKLKTPSSPSLKTIVTLKRNQS